MAASWRGQPERCLNGKAQSYHRDQDSFVKTKTPVAGATGVLRGSKLGSDQLGRHIDVATGGVAVGADLVGAGHQILRHSGIQTRQADIQRHI